MTAERFFGGRHIDISAVFEAYQDLPAVVRPGERPLVYTFGEVACRLAAMRRVFKELGVSPGDRVALYMENDPLHFLIFFLSWVDGFWFLPLDPRKPFEEAAADASPDVVIGPLSLSGKRKPVVIPPEALAIDEALPGEGIPQFPPVNLSQPCSLVFTSGSTGRPRGVVHTTGNHVYSAAGVISFFRLGHEDRWLVSLPLNHVGGLSIFTRTFLSGSVSVFPASRHAVDKAVLGGHANFISMVPTQLIRFMSSDALTAALARMRAILLGGSSVPGWVIERALDLSLPIVPSYGLTESCSLVTAVPLGSKAHDYKTAGKMLPYRKLALDGKGRVLLGGKTRFAFCLEEGETVFPPADDLFVTSDLGHVDERGNWVISGRADEVFISGGENINPFEIETHLTAIDGIDAAVVVPVPDQEFGHVPWAFIFSSSEKVPEDIAGYLKRSLPSFKVPKKMIFMAPGRVGTGLKADRAALKRKAAEMAGKST